MKKTNKVVSLALCGALLCSSVLPVFAADADAPLSKDESVFITLNSDGSIKDQTVSDHLHAEDGIGSVADVSTLQNVQNTQSAVAYTQNGNTLTWDGADTDVYYSGSTAATPPVSVQIQYTLDGQQASAEALTGKSGHLMITVKLTNNEMAEEEIDGATRTVCTPFITVLGTLLDAEHFSNVKAEHGTLQKDGNNQIVGFVCLPGVRSSFSGLLDGELSRVEDYLLDTVTIEADVTDFTAPSLMLAAATDASLLENMDDFSELDGMSDDLDKLDDAVAELLDGAKKLADGARQLNDGAVTLKQGTDTLQSGAERVATGADKVLSGANQINGLLTQLSGNNAALNKGASDLFDAVLSSASAQLNASLDAADPANAPHTYALTQANFTETMNALSGGVYTQVKDAVEAGIKQQATPEVTTAVKRNVAAQVLVTATAQASGQDVPTGDAMNAAVAAVLADPQKVALLDAAIANTNPEDALTVAVQQTLAAKAAEIQATIDATVAGVVAAQWADPDSQANATLKEQLTAHGYDTLVATLAQLTQVQTFVASVGTYTGAVASLQQQGAAPLVTGATELRDGAKQLSDGAKEVSDGAGSLTKYTGELADGAGTLYDGFITFDAEGISKLTDSPELSNLGTLQAVAKAMQTRLDNYQSYTGAPEGAATSVKFIMKTEVNTQQADASRTENTQDTEQPSEKTSFWTRVTGLFKHN